MPTINSTINIVNSAPKNWLRVDLILCVLTEILKTRNKDTEESFGCDGCVYYLDRGDGFRGVDMCPNSTNVYPLIMCIFLCISYTSVKLEGGMYLTTVSFLHVMPNKHFLNLAFSESSRGKHDLSQQRPFHFLNSEMKASAWRTHILAELLKLWCSQTGMESQIWWWCPRQKKRKDEEAYWAYFDYDGQRNRH